MTRSARGAQAARPGTLHAASDSPGSPGRFLPVGGRRVSGGQAASQRVTGLPRAKELRAREGVTAGTERRWWHGLRWTTA